MVHTPQHLLPYLPYCLAVSTWSTYRTAYRMYLKFLHFEGWELLFPITYFMLTKFIIFMFETRHVTVGTIKQYLGGLRFLHDYAGLASFVFDDPRIGKLLQALLNLQRMKLQPSTKRRVFTFPCLQLLGHELSLMTHLGYEDKQAIWVAILLAYWGCLRFGEILPGSHGVCKLKLLRWSRIRYISDNHLAIFIALPKQDRKSVGVVKHFFSYKKDPTYCPIANLRHLYKIRAATRNIHQADEVFQLFSGKFLRMHHIRKILKATDKYFPDNEGRLNCHSLRAGLATLLASHPEVFSEIEIKDLGAWDTDTYLRYTRQRGIGQKRTHRKVVAILAGARKMKRAKRARKRRAKSSQH